MSMNVSTSQAQAIQSQTDIEPGPNAASNSSRNSVGNHVPAQQTAGTSPTDGARKSMSQRHADIESMTEERLMSDPAYRELKETYDTWKDQLMSDFMLVDQYTGVWPDKKIQHQDLIALRDDKGANPQAREAAIRLLENPQIWQAISKDDVWVGVQDVESFLATMKSDLKANRDTVRGEVKAEMGVASAATTAIGGQAAGGEAAAAGEAGPLFKSPAPSTKPGMEGAVENLNNTLGSIGDAMADITAKMTDANLKPEERQKLQASYNELQQLQSMLMAMYKQLQESIANMMKMYSDVAQNSIRNMR